MSDTPRTDKALKDRGEPMSGLLWADFARTLERENQQLREAADTMAKALAMWIPVRNQILSSTNSTRAFDEALAAYQSLSQGGKG